MRTELQIREDLYRYCPREVADQLALDYVMLRQRAERAEQGRRRPLMSKRYAGER